MARAERGAGPGPVRRARLHPGPGGRGDDRGDRGRRLRRDADGHRPRQARDHRRPDRREGRATSVAPGTGTGTRAACATSSPTSTCRSSRRPASCRPSATPAPRRSSSTPSCWPARSTSTPTPSSRPTSPGRSGTRASMRWQVTTSRGDRLSSRFLVLAGGILHKAKLPGIAGIEDFDGKAFHTSRWDYGYTGGRPDRADGPAGRQAGRHHRHRGHRRAGGAPDRPCGQGALRLPADPGSGRACATSSPPTSSGSRAWSPAGSTSGSSTSPRRSPVPSPRWTWCTTAGPS